VIVREIKSSERDQFFLLAHKHGAVYLDAQWLKIYPVPVKLYGIFPKKSNDLFGGFVLYKQTKFGFPYLKNLPFTPHICLFYSNRTTNPSNNNSFRKKILTAISDFISTRRVDLVNIAFPPDDIDMQPFIWKGLQVKVKYTYQIALDQDENTIYSNFSPERRNDITKALKDGIVAEEVTQYKDVENLVLKTFEINKIRGYSRIVESVFRDFAVSSNSVAFVACRQGKPSACSFVIYNERRAYYILGGYDKENRHHGAGALCLWESIKAVKQRNVRMLDLEGSMVPSIESFFRGFGGDLIPFFQIRKYPFLN
jgi:hypothetical protein